MRKALLLLSLLIGITLTACTPQVNLYQNTPPKNAPITTNEPTPSNSPALLQLKNSTKTTGWKTYINATHSYEVSFPADWQINADEANNIEEYKDSTCCNTAVLNITNNEATWEFAIDTQFTGGDYTDSPELCYPKNKENPTEKKDTLCDSKLLANTQILGYPASKYRYFVKATNKTYLVIFKNAGTSFGFGEIGTNVNKEIYDPAQPKYSIEYRGEEIDKNLTTLDKITASLVKI